MRTIHVSVRVAPGRSALSPGDLLKFFIIIIINIIITTIQSKHKQDSLGTMCLVLTDWTEHF